MAYNTRFVIRTTDKEKELAKKLAKDHGMLLSDFIRGLIKKEAENGKARREAKTSERV